MKKLCLTSALVLGVVSGANAINVNPYVSEKISFSRMKFDDNKNIYTNQTSSALGTDESANVFGNRLAVGFSIPVDLIRGGVRTELEWGINSKAKIDSALTTLCYGGVCIPNPVDGVGTKGEVKTQTFMLNAYYDINTGTKFTPYAGFGIGFAHFKSESEAYGIDPFTIGGKSSTNEIVQSLSAGVVYAITNKISVETGYRYTDFGTPENKVLSVSGGDYTTMFSKSSTISHEIMLGARYVF